MKTKQKEISQEELITLLAEKHFKKRQPSCSPTIKGRKITFLKKRKELCR